MVPLESGKVLLVPWTRPIDIREEDPKADTGCVIVFDEKKKAFGLASWDGSKSPRFLGYYGTFLDSLDCM